MKLRLALALSLVAMPAAAQQYRFPIELPSSGTQPYVTAYRDHDSSGGVQDWNCGSDTYDGHKGTDFGIGSWPVMDAGSRWVVAAADGKVVFVNDGCFDHCSTADCNCGGGFGNYVKITHADGKSTYYGHMMTNSILVAVGDQVTCGQHLGKVGSSGFSSGPHLHFEPRYSDNSSDEPFSGSCGGPISFWVSQGAYKALPADQCENPPPPDVDDATLVSETIASGAQFSPGESFDKSWTIENTGTTTWSKPSYTLAHDDGETFGVSAPIDLADGESIAPAAQKTFTVTLVAPANPGSYGANFRMDHAGVGRFGALLHVEITVANGGSGGTDGGSGASAGWSTGGAKLDSGAGKGGSGAGSQKTKVVADDEGGGCGCRASASMETRLIPLLALLVLRRRRRR